MAKNKEYYVGWQDKMPDSYKKVVVRTVMIIAIVIPLFAFLLVSFQRPFNDHTFQLGSVSQLTGIYHSLPVPLLEVDDAQLPEGYSNHVLLVGFGKFGAEGIMNGIQSKEGSLERKEITMQGTLIYGDGKTVFELTRKSKSLISVNSDALLPEIEPVPVAKQFSAEGEILDPKCYFGVMKPGEGKIHRSCAVRCISGGIPPVFRSGAPGAYTYHIIVGSNGQKINKEILDFVGIPVVIGGTAYAQNGWNVLKINSENLSLNH